MARAMGPRPPGAAGGAGGQEEASHPWVPQPPLQLVQLHLLVQKQPPSPPRQLSPSGSKQPHPPGLGPCHPGPLSSGFLGPCQSHTPWTWPGGATPSNAPFPPDSSVDIWGQPTPRWGVLGIPGRGAASLVYPPDASSNPSPSVSRHCRLPLEGHAGPCGDKWEGAGRTGSGTALLTLGNAGRRVALCHARHLAGDADLTGSAEPAGGGARAGRGGARVLLEDRAVGLECICCGWTGTRDPRVREAPPSLAPKPLSSGMEGPACTWAGGPGWRLCQARLTPPAADERGIGAKLAVRMGPGVPEPACPGPRGQGTELRRGEGRLGWGWTETDTDTVGRQGARPGPPPPATFRSHTLLLV